MWKLGLQNVKIVVNLVDFRYKNALGFKASDVGVKYSVEIYYSSAAVEGYSVVFAVKSVPQGYLYRGILLLEPLKGNAGVSLVGYSSERALF